MPYRTYFFLIILSGFFIPGQSLLGQPGGKAFQFLEVTNSARVAALGGDAVAVNDNDLDLPYHNPAMLSAEMRHDIVLNYVNYFAGVNYGYASAATALKKGTIAGGIHYLNYGKFQGADENGALTNTFKAADYSINVLYSRPLDSLFTIGITMKTIFSDLESYNSSALAVDVGLMYHSRSSRFSAGLVFRNAGFQMNTYYPNSGHEPLPFEIALGITQSLKYAPLTFYVMADHLEKWDLTYTTNAEKDKEDDPNTGTSSEKQGFDLAFDKLMRHMVIGTEIKLGKNIWVRAGYNYRRRQELKIDTRPGMVGFSWGLGVKISKFKISYGHPTYHLAGGGNYFSFSMNLDELSKKF